MASNGIQIAALILAIIGTVLAYFATINHEWAKNDTSGSVIESLKTTVGLWARCTEVSTGHNTCDHYDNLLLGSVPILVVARLFCILSLLLGTIGAVIFLTGMSCTQLGSTPAAKKKMRMTSGIMEAVGGVLILIAGIFMGVYIVRHYWDQSAYFRQPAQGYQAYSSPNTASFFGRKRRDTADYEDVYADDIPQTKTEEALDSYIKFLKKHPHFEPNCEGNAECEAAVAKKVRVLPTNQKMVFGVGTFMAWIAGVIQMIGGGIMLAQSCGNDEEEYDGYDSQYGGYQQGIVKGNTGSTQGGAGRNYV